MSSPKTVSIDTLALDLKNYRTTPQPNETHALRALIAINRDRFWALAESLLDDGYLATENIIVLKQKGKLVVKEGNRRIAALKLICGILKLTEGEIPSAIAAKIKGITEEWRKQNKKVPCTIYGAREKDTVDKIVTLIHGKGEQAGRAPWEAVARARHSRDLGNSEPALDILEKYLQSGKNLTSDQGDQWAGEYPLTVLSEAMSKIAPLIGLASARVVANDYPSVPNRSELESVLLDIGLNDLGFSGVRHADFATDYGFPVITPPAPAAPATPSGSSGGPTSTPPASSPPKKVKPTAYATTDPRSVKRVIKAFHPRGVGREKVETLLAEARHLNLDIHPHSFCFLLRSMFEISAKAYCDDHATAGGPKYADSQGNDRKLVEILRDVTTHITKSKTDRAAMKRLKGAMSELATADGFLSVTSMNQLIHHTHFTVTASHICSLFWNIFPLLEAMNE